MGKRWLAWIILPLCIVILVVTYLNTKSELAPLEDRSGFRLSATAPEGSSYEYMDAFVLQVVQLVKDSIPEREVVISVTSPGFIGSGAPNTAFLRVMLNQPDQRKRSQQEVINMLNKNLRNNTMARVFAIQEATISTGGPGRGQPIQFVIQNSSFEKIREFLPKFMEKVYADPTFQTPDVDLKFNKPELNVSILRDRAQELHVSVDDIATTLQLAFSGSRISYFTLNGKQYQVIGQFSRENRDDPTDLKSLYVRNTEGELIQLDNVVKIEDESSPPQIYHYNRFKSATISATPGPGKTIGDGVEAMQRIAKEVLDESFFTSLAGESKDYSDSGSSIVFAFILALVLVYLVLAAQFESFIDPIIIMVTVPLAIAGAFISLWYFNQTWNIFSQIGVIMLIGLVTKNGILIVEFANHIKSTGVSKHDAAIQAATMRLRPILMTSLATALGALPIALSLGAASTSRVSLGIVIVGGIMFSLVLTLFVIPAMYSFLSKEHRNIEKHINKPV